MLTPLPKESSEPLAWSGLLDQLQKSQTLATLVIAAWQMGLHIARILVEQQLNERAQQPTSWDDCPVCGHRLHSKGFASRQMLTLVGRVQWRRRVGRCPNGCAGSHSIPFDQVLGIEPYQQSSVELMRLGCLLAIFVPFELAAWLLAQLSGIRVSDDSLWQWVQQYGKQSTHNWEAAVEDWQKGHSPPVEDLSEALAAMPLLIAADGVTVPLRPQVGSPKGKTRWREVKVAILARLSHRVNQNGKQVTRLQQRRLVAVLGDMQRFQPRLQLEAIRQGVETAPKLSGSVTGHEASGDCLRIVLSSWQSVCSISIMRLLISGRPLRPIKMATQRVRLRCGLSGCAISCAMAMFIAFSTNSAG